MSPLLQKTSFPASSLQERFWLADASLSAGFAVHFAKEIDVERLQRALDTVVSTHEALRTSIRRDADAMVQEIARERDAESLFRATITGQTLVVAAHPAIVDATSLRLIFDALQQAYAGGTCDAPELHYVDYSEWQRTMPAEEQQKLFLYWQYQLRDVPATMELPTARPRGASNAYTSGNVTRRFSADLGDKLASFCDANNVTRFNALYTAFATLLHRYSGQEDLLVGTTIDTRAGETGSTVGPIASLAALRTRVSATDNANDLLYRNAAVVDGAREHAAISVDKLAQLLSAENTNLFEVVFNVDENAAPAGDWTFEPQHRGFGNYDLNVLVRHDRDTLVCDVNYNAELHDATFVDQLARHYERVLGTVLAGANVRISDVDLLGDDERHAIVTHWGYRPAGYDANAFVHGLFEEQVRLGADRIAVTAGNDSVTYRQLDERANRVAHALLARDVEREQLIAVHVDPSIDTVVAILGVLKAGCAYLPLDVKAPAQRKAYQLNDAGCRLLLTANPEACSELGIDGVIDLNALDADLPVTSPGIETKPTDLAYCIYTSGSTGMPKGVLVEHNHVVRLLQTSDPDFAFDQNDVWTLFHNFNFDFSVWEMYGALFFGGRLVIVPDESKHNSAQLLALLEREQVTVLNQTPSAFYRICDAAGDAKLALRYVIFGGESLDPTRLRGWHARHPQTKLVNGYGITETTVFSTMQPVSPEMMEKATSIIGRAMPTVSCYVLDEKRRPVPAGVTGEIYVGGRGVTRGYLNRPELNAERFIANPLPGVDEDRLYKSGDLARWLADGRLEFLGRRDNQVQLRGYRIELGEIESQLVRQSEIKDAVVIVRTDAHGDDYLAAYLVPSSPLSADAQQDLTPQYRNALKSVLPPYMVPSAFVFLDRLPLTPNGKLDKKALPDPDHTQVTYTAPETAGEQKLAAIWQDILKLKEPVSVTADFFGLGGHSLLAMRAVSAINGAFDTALPVKAIFEHNTVRELAAVLEGRAIGGYESIPVVPRNEPLPLSFAQQRLWFIDRLEEGSAQYNMPVALRLTGNLRFDALQRSLDEIVERHEVIRSTYKLQGETGVQVVHPAKPLAIHRTDLSGFDAEERDAQLREALAEEGARPFNLAHDLMLRVQLLTLAQNEHVLLFTMHHIASDGWSMGVLIKELVSLYEGHCLGIQIDLPELPIQYADYAAWQRSKSGDLAEQVAYWKSQLANAPGVHSLPLDRPRPAQQQFAGAHVLARLPKHVLAGLNRLASHHNATLFMVLQSAFSLLLSRWSGVDDVVIGTPSAGRSHQDTEGLIGFFINTLVLRTEIADDLTFAQLLDNARQTTLDAFANQDVPFEMVIDELKPERSLSHSPLYQIVFALQNNERVAAVVPELEIAGLDGGPEIAKFDLQLAATEFAEGLTLTWNYATSLFDAATIERMANSFNVLLEGIVAAPQTRVRQLPILTKHDADYFASRAKAVQEFPEPLCLHEVFEQQVERNPRAVAVTCEGESLTYEELNARANQVAHGLIARGVTPDTLVGICVERSLEMIVGLLGILKSGAAYLPLDPDYPAARLQYMIDDANVGLVLTQAKLAGRVPVASEKLLVLDGAFADYSTKNPDNLATGVVASSLAYVIYTSGSTGNPKGVMIEHRQVARLLDAADLEFHFDEKDVWTLFHSYAFDFSVWEIWGALLHGAKLVVVPFATTRSPEHFYELLQRERVTVLNQTPSAFYALTDVALGRAHLSSLRYVVFGGEALVPSRLNAWSMEYGDDQPALINMYGITETTVHVTYRRILALDCESDVSDIGLPLADLTCYVGGHGSLAPIGVPGELFVGGAGCARGYLNKPELTATRFIANPFNDSNERVYRTGDLVRYRPDGQLEYLGRIDDQVKIRGFRIELGEIASQILGQPGVKEALVIAKGEGSEKRLIAYVVPNELPSDHATFVDALKRGIRQSLPDYMVPPAFVLLAAFPLTRNGKIDRKALPEPDWQLTSPYVAPRNEVEIKLAEIWAQLLKLERVGIEDNFFAVGGDSILSIQAVARANQAGIAITTRQLFEHQTIAALAAQAKHGVTAVMPQEAATGSISLLPIQREFLAEEPHVRNHFNQSVLLETPEGFDASFLRAMVAALYRRHDALRLRFTQDGAEHVELSEEMIAASAIVEPLPADVTARCNHWQRSFDLETGPLFRAVYFEPGRLFLVAHHIVVDGVSWRILLADIEQAYSQYTDGEAIALAPKTSSFQQWGAALAEYAQTRDDEKQYWLAQYDRAVQPLPVDRVAAERPSYTTSKRQRVRLSAAETKALLQRCAPVYRTTINELLLSGVYLGMRNWTGSQGLRIALEGHGRESLFEQLDTTQTVGWFTTVFPLTLESATSEVADVIKSIKEQYRALPNHGIGFGVLRHLSNDAELAAKAEANPPQLVFNYLGQFDQSVNNETALQGAVESTGNSISPDRSRSHPLGLNGLVANGALEFALDYSELEYDATTMATLARFIEDGLRAVIDHCLLLERGDFTPSDFPLAKVTQPALDAWQKQYPGLSRLYPATAMQQGLFFHSQLDRGSYVTQIYPMLVGELSTAHFRRAWELVSNRHDVFRTAFVGEDARLHQLVVSHVTLPWEEHDWRGLSAAEQTARFAAFREADKAAGFDFAHPPLQRITLFRMADDRWQMLWSHHHMLLDGWCTPLVYKEVMLAYQHLVRGEAVQFGEAPLYQNYIQWLEQRDAAEGRAYWREYLAPIEGPTPLGIDKLPRDGRTGFQERSMALGVTETQRLEAFAKANHTTVNSLLQLAWGYLLHRYSGESQVLFGAITSGRPADVQGVEEMIGLFINAIPVRVAFEKNATTAAVLAELHRGFQLAQEHSYLPLNEIQRQTAVAAGVPLFDSLLVFENYPVEAAMAVDTQSAAATLRVEGMGSSEQTNYKISLICGLSSQLKVRASYLGENFAEETIVRMLAHLELILGQLTAHESIGTIEVVTETERALYDAWNDTADVYPHDVTMHQLFEAQAAATPDATAVVLGEQELTYAELNVRANRLAHFLIAKNVEPDTIVGIYVDRSLEMIVGMVAILKAGAAYMPLDPSYPTARLQAMLEDSNAAVVLTQEHLIEGLRGLPCEAVIVGNDFEAPSDNLANTVTPRNLAYVMYTSGSTGRPKGVEVEHLSIVRLVINNDYVPLNAETRMMQTSSCSFDVATFEIWGALLNGGVLVLYPERYLDMDVINRELAARNVNTMWLTSGLFDQWTQQLPAYDGLTWIMAGGDVVNPRAVERVYDAWPHAVVINGYGPTENTSFTTCHTIPRHSDWTRPVSLGKTINGTTIHVLDERMQPLPLGAIGELYTGGDGVARGYWHRPELTAEKFVVNPNTNERLYKTGDLVRWQPDGTLDFIGRADAQVKVRGFRIELGEIEAQLQLQPEVRETVVVARKEGIGKKIVAYIVPTHFTGDDADLIDTLKAALSRQMPEYMIPSAFVLLEALPLNPNGKIDRAALPEPDWQSTSSYVAPRNETEQTLAEIWQRLLKLDRVGIDDNFFAIGGDSILSIQAVSRANQVGVTITTRQLFENPTIAALAALAQDGTTQAAPQEAISGPATLLPIQQQFLTEDAHALHHFNQSVLLETPANFDGAFLGDVVSALLQRHDALRLRFTQSDAGQWQATHAELTDDLLAQSAITETNTADVSDRCAEYQRGFDLANGPLFRAVYFADNQRLLLVAHHIVVDGVSWRILLADIEQAYRQRESGEAIVLGPKTSSFQQWGEALAQYSQSLDHEKQYWLAQYDREVAPLPVDRITDERRTYRSSRVERLRLTANETTALLQQCAPVYRTTINELLLSGVYLGMRQWTDASGLRIALEGHGRESIFDQLDTTQTVGWFTTVFPLALQSATGGVADVIKSVKEQYRALPNNGIGFGLLRHLAQDEDLVARADANPPQIVFNYLGQFDQTVSDETALRGAGESMGPATDLDRLRPYRLGLNGRVAGGVLEFTLDYSSLDYDSATINKVASFIADGLRAVIAHCLETVRGDFTPSDFPLAKISQARLDAWQQTYPDIKKLYPATGMQQGMYFHGLLDRGAYVTQIYPVFIGDLSPVVFRQAWDLVSNRHDIFRTAFVGQEEKLHQLVVSHVALPWQELDWRDVPVEEQRGKFERFRDADKAAGFDFAQAPLQRITLIRLSEDRWQLLWSHHHMLLDGWCAPLVYKEVVMAYQAISQGTAVQFPEAPLYENYIQWLQKRDVNEAYAFWREQLAGIEAPTPLVVDKLDRDGRHGFQEQLLALSAEQTQKLEAFAKANQTTVNTLMQLAWGYLLHRYSGEQQVVFGAITSGRPAEVRGIEQMIGLFINTIPVQVAFEPGASTTTLLAELHRNFQRSQDQSWLPLAEIQQQSAVGAGVPLFDSLLAFENYPVDTAVASATESRGSNLRVESSATDERTNYKLTLIVTAAGTIKVRCGYMAENFAHATVERLLGHLEQILRGLTSEAQIENVDLVTDRERADFNVWNDTAEDIPTDVCLHQGFVERAVISPDAIAIRDFAGTMTYEEVFRRALALSRTLQSLDVQREELVGVRLPKGGQQVVATLGIMMSGGAYLPMEMNWPEERCKAICDLAGVRYVVASDVINLGTQFIDPATIVPVEGELATLANEISYEGLTDKLAYVIFTSGSTGTPKGVAIEHAAAVNTCIDVNQRYGITHEDKVLAVSALSFDLSVYDIFGLLAIGGEVIFPSPDKAIDPRHWAELIETHGVTLWDTVPASADLLAQHFEAQGRASTAPLRTIMMSGDWIHPALPARLWKVFPHAKTWSLGGATEASIWSINYPIVEDTSGRKSVPYGKPMANQSFHVLDKKLREVPVGVVGELFIGGRGVARCYYGDTERSANSFIQHDALNRKLYRTGDMGRYLPDGNIEFIGRVDHQVKIRGFRIELGEIEAVLTRHAEVDKVLVEVRGAGNDKYLAAYIVPSSPDVDATTLVPALRQAARAALPGYMVPAAYVLLESFPLTANGKVDKKSLPEPALQLQTEYVAPSTNTEAALVEVWRELLGSQREIGVTENFFEAGGNSLLAMQILYRVENRLGCRLDIADVFSYQTIQLLARFIDAFTDTQVIEDEEVEELSY